MSRSGYSDDCDGWALIRWRGAVASAIRGKRGQAFLRELVEALDAMPTKALIAHSFQAGEGFCTLGVICDRRGIAVPELADPDDWGDDDQARQFAKQALEIPGALASEIMFLNDTWHGETPEHRWLRMRNWAAGELKAAP